MNDSPQEYFEKCLTEPLALLRQMKDGKGSVVALATALFLFERYWSILPESEREPSRNDQISKDFKVSAKEAEVFWSIFRNGLLHLGSPMQSERGGKPLLAYSMRPDAVRFLDYQDVAGVKTLIVNPWLFCDRVLELWRSKIRDLDSNKSAPMPKRHKMETFYYTDSPGHTETRIVEEM